ncbi:hypothetical protein [Sphaerochaeta sp. PS]|uniref:hypothetical protein n=1 Tax=Sphaerochaeta sp. PS TaxID=3076336 RepID=UPI0028A56CB9|nr:hypothetical protein [Sphaerochaeta sp. PS]MDT4760987.1 hypothetical protein [Sphaerochaeta sp. PS]
MLLDVTTLEKIDPLMWHSLPDANDGIIADEIWKCGPVVCTMLKNPRCKSGEDLVSIPYAMAVKRGKNLVLVVSLEQEDLRSLSLNLGCSLKELQQDYGTKSNFSELRAYIYSKDEREDLGPYEEKLDLQRLRLFFLDTVCDTLDIVEPPEQVRL